MPINQSRQLRRVFSDGAKIQELEVPNKIAESIVPVLDVTPNFHRLSRPLTTLTSLSNALSAIVYNCSTVNETYLTGATLSYIKDATATSTSIGLSIIDDETNGVNALIRVRGITLTAQNGVVSWNTNYPIRLKKGSTITITSDTNVANVVASVTLQGYEVSAL